jgi:hypothetical protein
VNSLPNASLPFLHRVLINSNVEKSGINIIYLDLKHCYVMSNNLNFRERLKVILGNLKNYAFSSMIIKGMIYVSIT